MFLEKLLVRTLAVINRGEHSTKPPEARERIVDLFGDVPRVELFARDMCPGWEQTGLELDGMDVREYIECEAPAACRLPLLGART